MGKHTRMQTTQAGRPPHTAKRNTKTRKQLIHSNVGASACPDIVHLFYGHFLIVYLLTHFAICAPRGTTNAVLRVTIHSKIRR